MLKREDHGGGAAEPFATQAEQSMGVTLIADLDQGATAAFRCRAAPSPAVGRGAP